MRSWWQELCSIVCALAKLSVVPGPPSAAPLGFFPVFTAQWTWFSFSFCFSFLDSETLITFAFSFSFCFLWISRNVCFALMTRAVRYQLRNAKKRRTKANVVSIWIIYNESVINLQPIQRHKVAGYIYTKYTIYIYYIACDLYKSLKINWAQLVEDAQIALEFIVAAACGFFFWPIARFIWALYIVYSI